MQYINSIPLNSIVTVYTPDIGDFDIFGKKGYTRAVYNAAIFRKTSHSTDNYMREKKYKNVVYVKSIISENALIYIGENTATDPATISAMEVKEFSPMENINQVVIGFKIWL